MAEVKSFRINKKINCTYEYVTAKHVQDGIIEDQENVLFCTVFHLIKAVTKLQPNGCILVNCSLLKQNVVLTNI